MFSPLVYGLGPGVFALAIFGIAQVGPVVSAMGVATISTAPVVGGGVARVTAE